MGSGSSAPCAEKPAPIRTAVKSGAGFIYVIRTLMLHNVAQSFGGFGVGIIELRLHAVLQALFGQSLGELLANTRIFHVIGNRRAAFLDVDGARIDLLLAR